MCSLEHIQVKCQHITHYMFFLPLPPSQLYIIINGVPTKDKIVWQTLVDVNAVKVAIQKLKEINWLYKNVDDASLDEQLKYY